MTDSINLDKFKTNDEFDLGKFNSAFDENKQKQKEINDYNSKIRLEIIKQQDIANNKKINMTIIDFLIKIKDSWFYLIDDLLLQNFSINTFTKNNRLFYIGLTFILFSIVLLFANQANQYDNK